MVKFLDLKKISESFEPELSAALERTLRSGWYLQGDENKKFEQEYSEFIGVKYTVGCGNGLDALKLILQAYIEMGVLKVGDEVIVPANTYIASILAITATGLIPVLVEPEAETFQIDAEKIENVITEKTKVIMIVHLYGKCAYNEKIGDLCKKYNLRLIEDNAQAHGCEYNGRKTGSIGDAAGHSFYPGKNLGALGDGGAVTTNDARLAEIVKRLGNYGSDKKYVFESLGMNSRLDEMQAAALSVKLKRLESDNDRRREIALKYVEGIKNPAVRIVDGVSGCGLDNVYHVFPVLCEDREKLIEHLKDKDIQTLIHYPIAPHKQKCYADKGLLKNCESLPITEYIHDCELSLPISPVMSDEDVERVIKAINSFEK